MAQICRRYSASAPIEHAGLTKEQLFDRTAVAIPIERIPGFLPCGARRLS